VIRPGAVEANKRLVTTFYEVVWNRWNAGAAEEILAPDLDFRGSIGLEARGVAAFLDYQATIRRAFPDFHNRIDELIGEGSKVVARLTYSGTHQGELFGHPPSRRRVSYAGVGMFECRDGKIAKVWVLGDLHGLLVQIAG
jgi:steroid delta-isomerase-like uncharacterized protein